MNVRSIVIAILSAIVGGVFLFLYFCIGEEAGWEITKRSGTIAFWVGFGIGEIIINLLWKDKKSE